MAHRVAYATLRGKTHRVNQDAGGAWTWSRPDGTPVSLVVVADGVSAGRHSEFASRLVVDRIRDEMSTAIQDPEQTVTSLVHHLDRIARGANDEIAARPRESLMSADATTLVVAVCVGEDVAGGWIGDSRIYALTASGTSRVSRDHSWAEDAVQRGMMTSDQAARDPRSHMITQWLGPQEGDTPSLETFRFHLSAPDLILCCSDGLYGYFAPPSGNEAELGTLLLEPARPLQERLDQTATLAMDRGGHDDITGAALQIERISS